MLVGGGSLSVGTLARPKLYSRELGARGENGAPRPSKDKFDLGTVRGSMGPSRRETGAQAGGMRIAILAYRMHSWCCSSVKQASFRLQAHSDADYVGRPDTQRSTTGAIVF